MDDSYLHEFRVVVVGSASAGKTALGRTLVNGRFPKNTESTIGVDLFLSILQLDSGIKVKMKIWDTAGLEIFRSLTRSFYRSAAGVLLVYDVGNRGSFFSIAEWTREAKRYTDNASLQLVACKCDLKNREVTTEEGMDFAISNGMTFVETSAKEGYNVREAFKMMAENLTDRVDRGEIKANTRRYEYLNGVSSIKFDSTGKNKGAGGVSKCSLCKTA